jgi:hypothetical protein
LSKDKRVFYFCLFAENGSALQKQELASKEF